MAKVPQEVKPTWDPDDSCRVIVLCFRKVSKAREVHAGPGWFVPGQLHFLSYGGSIMKHQQEISKSNWTKWPTRPAPLESPG